MGEDDPEKITEEPFGEDGPLPPRPPKTPDDKLLEVLQTIDNRLDEWRKESTAPPTAGVERELRTIRDAVLTIAFVVIFSASFGAFITFLIVGGEGATPTNIAIAFVISLVIAGAMTRNIEARRRTRSATA